MKKRVLLSVLLVSMFGQAWTQTFQIEDLWYSFTSDSTVEVCRGDYSEIIAVTIPEIVNYEGNQYVVKGIGDNAFYNYFTYPKIITIVYQRFTKTCCKYVAIYLKDIHKYI